MSQRREKRKRYYTKLYGMARLEEWERWEPPFWRIISWKKWQRSRPHVMWKTAYR